MDWLWYVVWYVTIGFGLAEGTGWSSRRNDVDYGWGAYLVVFTMWPLVLALLMHSRWQRWRGR